MRVRGSAWRPRRSIRFVAFATAETRTRHISSYVYARACRERVPHATRRRGGPAAGAARTPGAVPGWAAIGVRPGRSGFRWEACFFLGAVTSWRSWEISTPGGSPLLRGITSRKRDPVSQPKSARSAAARSAKLRPLVVLEKWLRGGHGNGHGASTIHTLSQSYRHTRQAQFRLACARG
jgi:hypothetical protein